MINERRDEASVRECQEYVNILWDKLKSLMYDESVQDQKDLDWRMGVEVQKLADENPKDWGLVMVAGNIIQERFARIMSEAIEEHDASANN